MFLFQVDKLKLEYDYTAEEEKYGPLYYSLDRASDGPDPEIDDTDDKVISRVAFQQRRAMDEMETRTIDKLLPPDPRDTYGDYGQVSLTVFGNIN